LKDLNVIKTRELDLCVSCEICSAACPDGAITMENRFGQFLPKVDDEKCTLCGLCLEICPGIDFNPFELKYDTVTDNIFDGPCLESYTAYSNNLDIRKNATSGGLITSLIVELIKNKEFDVAFTLPFDASAAKPARLKATNEISEIINSAKSKYVPASVYNLIMALNKDANSRCIIVGTPCQINGIKKYLRKSKISEEDKLFLGLFCDKTLNFNVISYFEHIYGKSNEKLVKFEFRTKEEYGWPGNTKLYFDSGRELIVDRSVRMQLKKFFQLNRCLFCFDKLNKLADIAFGDCYIKGKGNFNGKSSVIVRTEKGEEIFDKYSYLFTLERESIKKIRKSQRSLEKKDNLDYAKVFIKENDIYNDAFSDYEINSQVSRRLSKLQKYIKWGQKYNINKIRFSLFLSKILGKLRAVYEYTKEKVIAGIIMGEGLFIYTFSKKRHISRRMTPRNIIITGGELFNKGAQAMTFTVVDQIRRRFPEKKIYLFSTGDFDREDEEKNMYKFDILPWNLRTKLRLLDFPNRLFIKKSGRHGDIEENIRNVIKNAYFFIDISGYALSSQWDLFTSADYLLNIVIAKKYSVPYYIFPQSIGPFDYPLQDKIFLFPLMKLYLKYPKRIFPREKQGLRCVQKFSKKNTEISYDIVLQNKEYDLSNIYNKDVHFKNIKIEPNSVGIIPNPRVVERAKPDEIYSVYYSLINRLIEAKKTVYILRYSQEDLEVCEKIKNLFSDNKSVKLIQDDLNAIELENIINQFHFVIVSRYHSLIHSYKNGIPALVIGWATKYSELLENFNQLDYLFDVRNGIDTNKAGSKLYNLIRNYKFEKEKIANKMKFLIKDNIFDIFNE